MNKLLKQTLVCAGTLLLSMQVVAKPSSEAKEVRGIIDKVNTYWQTHNKPEVRSFLGQCRLPHRKYGGILSDR